MTTKDRILLTALDLFNEEGESTVSALEIANALDMSPGNLYYHFKGKDEIVPALLSSFHKELLLVLDFAGADPTDLEAYWFYIYVILEEIYDYRFLYDEVEHIVVAYPKMRPRVRRIMAAKRKAIEFILNGLTRHRLIEIPDGVRDDVVDTILMTMTFWLPFDALKPQPSAKEDLIHRGVFHIMTIILPYQTQPFGAAFRQLTAPLETRTTTPMR